MLYAYKKRKTSSGCPSSFLSALGTIPALAAYALWMVVAGFVLLALGNLLKDL